MGEGRAESPRKTHNPSWGMWEGLPRGGGDSWFAMGQDGLARGVTWVGGLQQLEQRLEDP